MFYLYEYRFHGFTDLSRDEYELHKENGHLIDRGVHVKVKNGHGRLNQHSVLIDR